MIDTHQKMRGNYKMTENVFDISVYRDRRLGRALGGKCPHSSVVLYFDLCEVECKQCKKSINPMVWLAEYWEGMKEKHQEYNRQIKIIAECKKEYERLSKCKCQHCGKMTLIRSMFKAAQKAARR